MNKACTIHFHPDAEPPIFALPERYQENTIRIGNQGITSLALDVGHAFYIDVSPEILRTRIGGREAEPIDFPVSSISAIEWYDEKGR